MNHNSEYAPCPHCEFALLVGLPSDWCNGTGWALPPVSVDEERGDIELEDCVPLDEPVRKQLGGVRPICEIDEVDLVFNWEMHACNWCDGMGQEHYSSPDGDEGWADCTNCGGTGTLATFHM